MNKKFIIICIVFLIVTVASSIFVGCQDHTKSLVFASISEKRQNLFCYNDDKISVTLSSGTRESPYQLDGKHTDNMAEYGILSVSYFLPTEIESKKAIVNVNTSDFEVELEQNPFEHCYMADIKNFVGHEDRVIVKLFYEQTPTEYTLECVSNRFNINYLDSLNIFYEQNIKEIKKIIKSSESFEVYIRLTSKQFEYPNVNYWFVSLLSANKQMLSCTIDTMTGVILSKNFSM